VAGNLAVTMRTTLDALLALDRPLLADGATGTNFFEMGLGPGEPPELWNLDQPAKVTELHQAFVDAGADIILTNTFGCNRYRLNLHGNGDRTYDIAKRAAELAGAVADAADRPVLVAGSVGPTGELLQPLGAISEDDAYEAFREQVQGLLDGGADLAWIETKSAPEEMRAAARAAISLGMPYAVTGSFDTAGRTMMGLAPADLAGVFASLDVQPVAIGANCGVGASDLLVAVQEISHDSAVIIAKSNCGIPQFQGAEIVYSGDPLLMAQYATLAVDSGARIIGGCCGTSPEHLAEMKRALVAHVPGDAPTVELIVEAIGPLTNTAAQALPEPRERRGRRSR
jgi:methionine synthase I (cobalamin-dependent)